MLSGHGPPACSKALSEVKQALVSSQLLVHYDSNLPLQLATDASAYGVGAVISHVYPNGDEKPIAFASQHFNICQNKLFSIREGGIVYCFRTKKVSPIFVWSTIFTDN